MIENTSDAFHTPRELLDKRLDMDQQYMGTAVNVLSRFQLYRYAADARDMHREISEEPEVAQAETLLDVGCADGEFFAKVIEGGSAGYLLGLELDADVLRLARARRPQLQKVGFLSGAAEELPLADNSIDTVTALFMLYHTPDVPTALKEFRRVLRPGGTFVAATSGVGNKAEHRRFEADIADYLGITPPPVFSSPFNGANAAELLTQSGFTIERHVDQFTEMRIGPANIEDYVLSLNTMKDTFSPAPRASCWVDALQTTVLPTIREAIEDDGYFADTIERHYYVCRSSEL